MLQAATLTFLKNLHKNNNKPWFDAHRTAYEQAKKDFEQFIESVIDKHGKKDIAIATLTAKACMFRINRDVRFAKDKSPYKNNMGASISQGGKKSTLAGYYFHCQPADSFVGGGIWAPMPAALKKVRQEVDYCYDEFKDIINAKKFKSVYGDLNKSADISLVKIPQGFEKNSPAGEYLKLKSFVAMKKLTEKELTSKDLLAITTAAFEALQPLLHFINRSLANE